MMCTISIIGGCGHIGLPLGVAFSLQSNVVNIVDIDTEKISDINSGVYPYYEKDIDKINFKQKNFSTSSDKSSIQNSEIVIWTFSNSIENINEDNVDTLLDKIKEYEKFYNKEQLFIIKSTIQIGTFDKILLYLKNLLGENVKLSYCPERISESNAFSEIYKLPQIVASNNDIAYEETEKLFKNISPKIIKLAPKEAEMSKLMLNAWRYIEFSISNNFYMLCQKEDLDFYKIFNAVKQDYPRAESFKNAGLTAGPCLTKDTLALVNHFHKDFELGKNAIETNNSLPKFLVSELIKKIGNLKDKKVLVLGTTFKANCDDKRNSLAFWVRDELLAQMAIPTLSDVFDKKSECEKLIENSDAVILTAPHDEYKLLKPKEKPYVDCWGFWKE